MHSSCFYRNQKERRERQLQKLARWREAKARKRQALIEAGLWEVEPRMVRFRRFEFGVKDKTTGETAWHDLVSVRHAAKAIGLVLKFCQ
jgi:hypothetical protein